MARAITRIAHEIVESNRGSAGLLLLGIPTRGVYLSRRLAQEIDQIEPGVEVGVLDTTMYRDDLTSNPLRTTHQTVVPADGVGGRTVVLVDDVLYSGRTVRAALDALTDLGRAGTVRLAVLIDRGHRQLPIRADFVGRSVPTAKSERVNVHVVEIDGTDEVTLEA